MLVHRSDLLNRKVVVKVAVLIPGVLKEVLASFDQDEAISVNKFEAHTYENHGRNSNKGFLSFGDKYVSAVVTVTAVNSTSAVERMEALGCLVLEGAVESDDG